MSLIRERLEQNAVSGTSGFDDLSRPELAPNEIIAQGYIVKDRYPGTNKPRVIQLVRATAELWDINLKFTGELPYYHRKPTILYLNAKSGKFQYLKMANRYDRPVIYSIKSVEVLDVVDKSMPAAELIANYLDPKLQEQGFKLQFANASEGKSIAEGEEFPLLLGELQMPDISDQHLLMHAIEKKLNHKNMAKHQDDFGPPCEHWNCSKCCQLDYTFEKLEEAGMLVPNGTNEFALGEGLTERNRDIWESAHIRKDIFEPIIDVVEIVQIVSQVDELSREKKGIRHEQQQRE